jgi:hypothetical protein
MTWRTAFSSQNVHGRQIDAYARLPDGRAIAIEVTEEKNINKLQDDINKLTHVRQVNFQNGFIQTECFCVTAYVPTAAMYGVAASININVMSVDEFRHKYLPFDRYSAARLARPFGSAVDPESGNRDNKPYVAVKFAGEDGAEYDADRLLKLLLTGEATVLTGEYGTGKSKSIEWLFEAISTVAWENLKFPISIDLRTCWGLRDRYEILRRHVTDLAMPDVFEAFVKAYTDGLLILLIDGFDELGVQVWTDNPADLIRLRADALSGVRDLISNQRGGVIVTGRDHYFDSAEELTSALGMANRNVVNVRTKDEFDDEELAQYLDLNSLDIEIPEWLPRKPLTCEFFIGVSGSLPAEAKTSFLDAPQFWEAFLGAVCERESRIHSSFDAGTIRSILVEVAAITRTKHENVGPISLSEIQRSFEAVVGHAPIDQATVLLQRLPGLGRTSADSQDRRFVDTYLLEGLRASHVLGIFQREPEGMLAQDWVNPLGETGLIIAGRHIAQLDLTGEVLGLLRKHAASNNRTLLLDLLCATLAGGLAEVDFGGLFLTDGHASVMSFADTRVKNLRLSGCMIDKLNIAGTQVSDVRIENSIIGDLEGVSSQQGIPAWLTGNEVARFSSLATTSRIRAANLGNAHKVLVTILRKTFFQRGSGRKKEALVRGLGKLVKPTVTERILGRLCTDGLLTEQKGSEGALYVPVRSQTARAGRIIAELTLSKDPIWAFVSGL